MDIIKNESHHDFLKEIKERIYKTQYDALKVVIKELSNLYWDIGKRVVKVKKYPFLY
ncbi:MAG: hypothetical protein Q7K21_05595 [Elusimicrobiota bacterium]|nr:hypothetical protein [Elusimicrobiota bacterium]